VNLSCTETTTQQTLMNQDH